MIRRVCAGLFWFVALTYAAHRAVARVADWGVPPGTPAAMRLQAVAGAVARGAPYILACSLTVALWGSMLGWLPGTGRRPRTR